MKGSCFAKILKAGFVLLIFGILLLGLLRTAFAPSSVNYYENRSANQLPEFSVSSFLDGTYQDAFESALSDQVHASELAKKLYNRLYADTTYLLLRDMYQNTPDRYYAFNDINLYASDYLLYNTAQMTQEQSDALQAAAESICAIAKRNPEQEFFVYYIEADADINFETGEKPGFSEYFGSVLDHAVCTYDVFAIDDFDTYSRMYYKTDHHWNHAGSYQGYRSLCALMGQQCLMEHGEEYLASGQINGSKLRSAKTDSFCTEPMMAYRYVFPAMDVSINEAPVSDYGAQNQDLGPVAEYGIYYGWDNAQVVFDTHMTDKESILLLGDSFDNAILKLLASQFHKTYSVDIRHYEREMGEPFNVDAYLAQNQIDKVLFVGSREYFIDYVPQLG